MKPSDWLGIALFCFLFVWLFSGPKPRPPRYT